MKPIRFHRRICHLALGALTWQFHGVLPAQEATAAPLTDAGPANMLPGDEGAAEEEAKDAPPPVIAEKEEESTDGVIDSPPWHDSMLEWPDWIPAEQREIASGVQPANHGGGLFPPTVWPLEAAAPLGPLEWPQPQPVLTLGNGDALPPPETLPPETMQSVFGQRPLTSVLDPGHLLPPERVAGLESLVRKWMNEESTFRTTVVVLGPTQQLPPDFDPARVHAEWFGKENGLLVFYYYQRPERTFAVFSRDSRKTWGDPQLREILNAAVQEAGRMSGPAEQLERFCYKTAIRLYWLPRTGVPLADAEVLAAATAAGGWKKAAAWTLAALGAAGAGAGALSQYWRRKRRAALHPVLLPDQDPEPRLGAAHCGGFAATLQFGEVAV